MLPTMDNSHPRLALGAQHSEVDASELIEDVDKVVENYYTSGTDEVGKIRFFPNSLMSVKVPYGFIMNKIIDPYQGRT